MQTMRVKEADWTNQRFVLNPSKDVVERVVKWFGFLTSDPIKFEADECHHLVSGAYNVALVEGVAEGAGRMKEAIDWVKEQAMSVAPNYDFYSGDRYLIQVCDGGKAPITIKELHAVQMLLSSFSTDADVAWGHSRQEEGKEIRVRVAAANIKRK